MHTHTHRAKNISHFIVQHALNVIVSTALHIATATKSLLTDMSAPQRSYKTPEDMCQSSSSLESSGGEEDLSDHGLLFPVARSSLLSHRLLRLRSSHSHSYLYSNTRRKREMTPAEKKDASYWDKRRKNNEAAKRSREKRRVSDLMMGGQLLALSEENAMLRAEVLSLRYHMSVGKEAASITLPPQGPSPLHYPITPTLLQPGVAVQPTSLLGHQQNLEGWFLRAMVHPTSVSSSLDQCSQPRCWDSGLPQYFPSSQRTACAAESAGSAEQEKDAHHQVSSSNDLLVGSQETPPASNRAFLPPFHSFPLSSTPAASSCQAQNWMLPGPLPVRTNLLMSCGSPRIPQPALYPNLPLYPEDREGDHHVLEKHKDFRDRFNTLAHLRRYLSRDSS
ncbi:hypothetical protein UPYG_G00035220 [Umbra pygmaea]|uniref:BZIP domain-containing protein n=1 Tax=Umbra pygmaea TaxID=75934 RepID=A0ABD0XNP0_UMBPY